MRADELMLGDWVNFFSKYTGKGIGIIGGIEPREGSVEPSTFSVFKYVQNKGEIETHAFFGVSRHSIKGVPLTEEILMKNFPTPETISWFPLDTKPGYFNVYWYGDAGEGGEIHLNIQYVHELQHILKLCNINKEIEL